jgi:hypothetical protein
MIDLVAPFKAFIKPWEEVKKLKGSLVDGLIYTEIGVGIWAVLTLVLASLLSFLPFAGVIANFGAILFTIGVLIAAPISLLVGSIIYYIIAKLLGGKGTFERQTFLLGAITYATYVILLIPIVGFLAILWDLVVIFFVLKEAHGLDDLKTLLVEFLPVILLAVVGLLLSMVVTVAFLRPFLNY